MVSFVLVSWNSKSDPSICDLICMYCKTKHQKAINCRLDHSTHHLGHFSWAWKDRLFWPLSLQLSVQLPYAETKYKYVKLIETSNCLKQHIINGRLYTICLASAGFFQQHLDLCKEDWLRKLGVLQQHFKQQDFAFTMLRCNWKRP